MARRAPIGAHVHLPGQGMAVYEVSGKTLYDPPDTVRMTLVSDPAGSGGAPDRDVPGWENVQIIPK